MSDAQEAPRYEGPNSQRAEGEVSKDETDQFRKGVVQEVRTEEENLALISRHEQRARRLVPLMVGLLILNIFMALTFTHYGISWIVASFLVYMYYFIILFFPTTRRVRTPADKLKGRRGARTREASRGAKGVILRGKKAVVVAFSNTFFIGTQVMARAMAFLMSVTIFFALLGGVVLDTLDPFSTVLIVLQAFAIIGYYYVIIRYRPYSKEFLKTVKQVRRNEQRQGRWQAYLKGVFIVLLLLTVFVVFLVSAILLPGRSLDAVLVHINQDFALALLEIVLIFMTQFIVVRYIQGFDSARTSRAFILNKMNFLKNDILAALDRIAKEPDPAKRSAELLAVQNRFRISRIYKIAYKDIFGILPTYPLILDFKSVLEKDVADALGEEIPLDIPPG